MKKSLQIISASALFISLFSLCLITPVSAQTLTTIDPNAIITTTTAAPLAPVNAILYDPTILQGATSGGTTTTTANTPPATTTTTTNTANTPTSTTTSSTTTTTTNTPPRTTVPPASTVPPATINQPPIATTCPPISPLSTENIQCPKVVTVPVIPQFPIALMAAPLLAVLLFWIIISYLNNGQIRTEKRFVAKRLANAHRQNVDQTRTREYQNLLDFLTKELSSPDGFHPDKYEMISAKIQLLGSPQMQNLVGRIDNAMTRNDRQSLKPLIKELGQQIKKEL